MVAHVVKFFIALALMPLVAGEICTLIDLARAAIPAGQLRDAWFLSLAAGAGVWLLIFVFLPRTMWIYVLGHELTHALAAMMAGGKVSSFQVSAKGGHVMTDRVNWWITLSPYFVPIYALIWMALWVSVNFYYPLKAYQLVLFFGVGVFWAFHLTFTISMFHLKQTDLSSQGIIFSAVVIVLINLLIFLVLFAILSQDPRMAGGLFFHRIVQCYVFAWDGFGRGAALLWQAWKSHSGQK